MWKDTLRKMPMPMNVATDRDKDYTQKIIAFEKEQIEPAFTKFTQKQKAGTEVKFRIEINSQVDGTKFWENAATFMIGRATIRELGGNVDNIINVIQDLYDKEGYVTKASGHNLYITGK